MLVLLVRCQRAKGDIRSPGHVGAELAFRPVRKSAELKEKFCQLASALVNTAGCAGSPISSAYVDGHGMTGKPGVQNFSAWCAVESRVWPTAKHCFLVGPMWNALVD